MNDTKKQQPLTVTKDGLDLLTDPLLNKGTAFPEEERDRFALHGLLPQHRGDLDDQVLRRLAVIHELDDNLQKHLHLRNLQDNNETLLYALLTRNLKEMLPLIYTPIVGQACQQFSYYWHRPRGLFVSYPDRDRIDAVLAHPRFDNVRVIVVSDGERILGLGDQGAGGMGIPIGKLSLYTACAGIDPATTLPVLLDTGTNNQDRLDNPVYIGWRHERIRGDDYEDFVDQFVAAVKKRWPHVLLQFEDFAQPNALSLLKRYRDELCTFNDDIQGTAAVATGTLLAAAQATGTELKEHTVVIFGAGSAGCGIGRQLMNVMIEDGLSENAAKRQFYALDSQGLLFDDDKKIPDYKKSFARPRDDVADWDCADDDKVTLLDVVRNAGPSILLGVSGQGGAFNEDVVRTMAEQTDQPIILALSNPESSCEARPQDVMDWTDGKALFGTGSPFDPVTVGDESYTVDQANNAYIFPGVGLGVVAVQASRVSDAMFSAAARALGNEFEINADGPGRLLPPIEELREVARTVARAVARKARDDGLCDAFGDDALDSRIDECIWTPGYRPYVRGDD